MSRIIMLIPLDQDVSLTTMSLSMVYFFNQNKINKKSCKPILYFSCVNSLLDDTRLIINKYFSKIVHTLDDIDFAKILFHSHEYFSLLNKIIELCYSKKYLYEVIIIEGLYNKYSVYSERINYDISQNLSSEVILIANLKNNSLKCIQNKTLKIKLFLEQNKYKNILGVIFNKINCPFLEKKYNFITKLTILKKIKNNKKELSILPRLFKENFFSIIACVPWNKKFLNTYIIDIYNFLKVNCFNLIQDKKYLVEKIIVFDESYINMLNQNYHNALIIVSVSRVDIFMNVFRFHLQRNKISGVILTGVLKSKKNIISLSMSLIQKNVSIFFTEKNTVEILSQLQNFDFNINVKDKIFFKKLQKYVSSFFCYSSIMYSKTKSNNRIRYSPKEFCYYLKLLSKKNIKRIILPESYESRILEAVSFCHNDNIAECVLLGNPKTIHHIANDNGIKLSNNIEIIDPILIREQYISRLIEIRKQKGMNESSARKMLEDNIVLATLILESNKVDGLVSGAVNTTSNTIRPALQIIKTNPNFSLVSSIFFMLLPNEIYIYGDCAINVNPTAEELAEIAIQSADSSKIFGIKPRIAMLSYSTGYSGSGYQVDKVRTATSIVKNRRPDLIIDGPIQYDSAVSKTVSKLKAPCSPIAGSANIFIFPDLNSGNIAYKAVQRSANILSIGPILQGLRKPVNDLSRGSSVEDIIYTIALTSIQSK